MANYSQERAQDAVCHSHTNHMAGLWFLPSPAFKAEYYNGKELRVEYTQSNTAILTSIINIMRVLTTTCFGLTRGPSSDCKIRLDKLYYNVWGTLLCVGGVGGTMAAFISEAFSLLLSLYANGYYFTC